MDATDRKWFFSEGLGVIFVLSVALWCFIPNLNWAQGPAPKDQSASKLIEEAKKEGKLLWYGSLAPNNVNEFLKYFREKYPTIQIEYLRLASTAIPTRVISEYRGGIHKADVIGGSAFPLYATYKADVLGKYSSPERKAIPEGFQDKDGYWTAWLATLYTIGYNTKLVSPGEAPHSYEDLLTPKWKGKIAMSRDDLKWFIGMLQLMGEEKGLAYMKRLSQQNLVIYGPGTYMLTQLLAAGEFAMATCLFPDHIEELKGKGAPVEWVRTNPMLVMTSLISMARFPPHPNAAKLFIDYILSEEGQQAVIASGLRRVATIPRFPEKTASKAVNILEPLKLYPVDPALAEKYEDYGKLWESVFFKK